MYRGRKHTKAKTKIVTRGQKGGESKNINYTWHEMYFGLKIRRLFKVWPAKTNTKNLNKKLNTASKKVTDELLYHRRISQRRRTLLEARIILTRLPETPASPNPNSRSLNSNDKDNNGVRELQWAVQDSIQSDPDQKARKSSLLVQRGDMKSAPKEKLERGP